MCTNAQEVALNALSLPEGNKTAPIITVEYGPYMNWGRWNHNASRVDGVVEELLKMGWAVQLKHEPEETTWEDHGFVTLKDSEGKVVATTADLQHNKNYRKQRALAGELAAQAGAAPQLEKVVGGEEERGATPTKGSPPPEDSEGGSTRPASDDGEA